MSEDHLRGFTEQQKEVFEDISSFNIPPEIAIIIALKTNGWGEIRSWDETNQLHLLTQIIWEAGLIKTMKEVKGMIVRIKSSGLNKIYSN